MKAKIAEEYGCDSEEIYLVHGTNIMEETEDLSAYGIVDESNVEVHLTMDGGKKKRKKKIFTKPKRVPHKHKKVSMAVLNYFSVEGSGKVKKLKIESSPGVYMADHPDRYVCGKTGKTFYKLTADGKRLPIPKNNRPIQKQEVAKAAPSKAKAKKKGKK